MQFATAQSVPTHATWMSKAAIRLNRSPRQIANILPSFVRGISFTQLAAETHLSVAELNWLFSQPWKFSAVADTIIKQLPPVTRVRRNRPPDPERLVIITRQIESLLSDGCSNADICEQLSMSLPLLKRIRRTLRGTAPIAVVPGYEAMWRVAARIHGRVVDPALGPEAAYRMRMRRITHDAHSLWIRGWTVDRIGRRENMTAPSVAFFIREMRRLGDEARFPIRGLWRRDEHQRDLLPCEVTWTGTEPWPRSHQGLLIVPTRPIPGLTRR